MANLRDRRRPAARAVCMALALGLVAASLLGCGGGGGTGSAAEAGASGCKRVEAPKPKHVSYRAPKQTVKPGEKLTAVVRTSCGTFQIALDAKRAPKTVNSFVFLAEKGFYDGLGFDRAAVGSFVQGGDPPGAAGGPGYSVEGQVPANFRYTKGVVAMAQSGEAPPGHAGSRFFVVVAPYLDFVAIYAPLGRVDKGLDVVQRIAALGPPVAGAATANAGSSAPAGKLRRLVLIEKISIKRG